MTYTINLSNRLKTVASFLPKGAFFADIGSDHAYLPSYVCLQDPKAKAIAGEVNQGPYESAVQTVQYFNLQDQIKVCLGDGLDVLKDKQVNQLTIAGMGGSLIANILKRGAEDLTTIDRIIVQPNIGGKNVRRWFLDNDFTLTNEVIIEENDHIYEILVADKGVEESFYQDNLKEKQLLFGPIFLKKRPDLFKKKWRLQQIKLQQIIKQMTQAKVQNKEKIKQFKQELDWIQEVTKHD